MKNYDYLFKKFEDKVISDDANDPVKKDIKTIARENGLTVKFNKVGGGMGGACVMPPDNQVTINLTQGADDKWRVNFF